MILPDQVNLNRKWLWLAVAAYVLLFSVTRLANITAFPLYIDEANHIFLAKLTLDGNFFVGLRETGKQIYIWSLAVALPLFNDPIFAARVVSIVAGLITAGICYKLAEMLYPTRRFGYLAALFYLVSPYAILFNRLALADTFLTMLIAGCLLVSVLLWRQPSVNWALVLGVMFALAALTKGYAVFYYPTPILLWLFVDRNVSWGKIAKLLIITYVTASVAWLLMFSVGWSIYERELITKSVVGSLTDRSYLNRLWHFSLLVEAWFGSYLTLPVIGLLIFTLVRVIIKRDKLGLTLFILVFFPLLAFALTFTELRSRYLFPLIVPFSVIIAWGVDDLAQMLFRFVKKADSTGRVQSLLCLFPFQLIIFFTFFFSSLLFSYQIIFKPLQAPFPSGEREEYILKGFLTYGYEEVAQLLTEQAQRHGRIFFLRYSLAGPLESILTVYLPDSVERQLDLVDIQSFDQITPQSLNDYAIQAPTFTIEGGLITSNAPEPDSPIYSQLWPIASFAKSNLDASIYQWLLPPDFAIHWFQQGGDADPRIAWQPAETLVTSAGGTLVNWTEFAAATPEKMPRMLVEADIEYVLATPELIATRPNLFAPFITTDGTTLTLKTLPPGWRLAFAYPNLNCEWCLYQLRPPDHSANIAFGEGETIELEGYDISMSQLMDERPLHLTLYWHSLTPISEAYIVFVHLLDENGQLVGQIDEAPLRGQWPTNHWRAGDKLADRHTVNLDSSLLPGNYTVLIGLYNSVTMARMPAQSNENLIQDNAVILTTIALGHKLETP